MSVVYQARDARLNRVVALKMLLGGSHSSERDRERFRREAELAASLDHPNTVRIFEIGEHAGLPFMALEFCPGGSLSTLLKGRPQAPRQAAGLLEPIARAAGSAHAAGLLHRDVKPANILLAADGSPKLGDFGLAKVAGSADALTKTGEAIGTLAYMAPEQAEGSRQTGPAADVYALGAVLYEQLTGRPPLIAETDAATLFLLLYEEPVPVRRLVPQVPADLETICHKCLAKDAARRYANGRELAEDLRRFLAREPIRARPIGRAERIVRWARRHPTSAAAAGLSVLLVLAVLLGGVGFVAYRERQRSDLARKNQELEQARLAADRERESARAAAAEAQNQRQVAEDSLAIARSNFQLARKAVSECLDLARSHPVFQRPGMQEARRLLLDTAVPYHQRFSEASNSSEQRREYARAQFESAMEAERLGDSALALQRFGVAVEELKKLVADNPTELTYRADLVLCRNNLGAMLRNTKRHAPAEAEFAAARALAERLVSERPDQPQYVSLLSKTFENQALLAADQGEFQTGLTLMRGVAEVRSKVAAAHPNLLNYQTEYGDGLNNLGVMHWNAGDPASATKAFQTAREIWLKLHADQPSEPKYQNELARVCNNLGFMQREKGDISGARRSMEEAIKFRKLLVAANPAVPSYRADLVGLLKNLGNICDELRDRPAALEHFREALALAQKLAADNPSEPGHRALVGELLARYRALGGRTDGSTTDSISELEKAVELAAQKHAEAPNQPELILNLARMRAKLGRELNTAGNHRGAGEQLGLALKLATPVAQARADREMNWELSRWEFDRGAALREQSEFATAAEAFRASATAGRSFLKSGPVTPREVQAVSEAFNALGVTLRDTKDLSGSVTAFQAAEELVGELAKKEATPQAQANWQITRMNLGLTLVDAGRFDEGLPMLSDTVNRLSQLAAESPKNRELQVEAADGVWQLAYSLNKAGRRAEADAKVRESIALWEALVAGPDVTADERQRLEKLRARLAKWQAGVRD